MAEWVKLFDENPNPKHIEKVVNVLKAGGVIIYPSDTVYGIGCDITNTRALERVAQLKNVKLNKTNFSFICNDLSHLSKYAKQIDTPTYKILNRALPGPYTFVLPGSNNLPKAFKNKRTVGIRVPDNNIIREIIKQLGNPIVSTSIYDEDEIIEYTTDPELIYEKWKDKVDLIIDGGTGGNIPSTIVDLSGPEIKVLREGKGSTDIF
ncbi:MAG: threonylcarbamoyl-AMP synthase [Flavobacteriaceae bacterium]|nr:threonylcarbamoyl-AMP synthase [Flavobacteriaceae bacterium]MCB0476050.1 threonylcarbamoyl-AMP synthase [Flavobacteriaceae bacterium]